MKKTILAVFIFLSTFSFSFGESIGEILGPVLFFSLNTKPLTKKIIIRNFCTIIDSQKKIIYTNSMYQFDPKKSIFLRLLCNTTGIYDKENFAQNIQINSNLANYLKLENNTENLTEIPNSILNDCRLDGIDTIEGSLNTLDLACVGKKIFDLLANDITNIAILKAYGNFSSQKELNNWQRTNFGDKICQEGNILNGANTSKASLCNHPLTYKYIKNLAKKGKSLLKNLNTIDLGNEGIDDFLNKLGYKDKDQNSFIKLKNLIYNELYFYELFLSYYKVYLQNMPSQGEPVHVGSSVKSTITKTASNLLGKINFYQQISLYSLNSTFQTIAQIKATFPIHIGFLIILEDLDAFRHALAKIYTPLDQLRYKLKNVQDLDKK